MLEKLKNNKDTIETALLVSALVCIGWIIIVMAINTGVRIYYQIEPYEEIFKTKTSDNGRLGFMFFLIFFMIPKMYPNPHTKDSSEIYGLWLLRLCEIIVIYQMTSLPLRKVFAGIFVDNTLYVRCFIFALVLLSYRFFSFNFIPWILLVIIYQMNNLPLKGIFWDLSIVKVLYVYGSCFVYFIIMSFAGKSLLERENKPNELSEKSNNCN